MFAAGTLTGLLALSLVVRAVAARGGSGRDGAQREWYALQGRYFDLAHEYRDATAARQGAILAEMHATIRAWRRIGVYTEWNESAML